MIIDRLEYAAQYQNVLPHLMDAVAFIKENPNPGPGKHTFPGGYLMQQSGETRALSDGDYEAHREYIDVQLLMEGSEYLLWNRLENMKETVPYDREKDKHAITGDGSLLELRPGMFAVLYPEDAHKACRHPEGALPSHYEKFVIKLKL
ncbi:MAG: YhcH/YjgK/YiaL family protein [Eubacteriales bacterium]|nr:YhcH/YjgK/YiaL family protein [Eubacteriales bacterium]